MNATALLGRMIPRRIALPSLPRLRLPKLRLRLHLRKPSALELAWIGLMAALAGVGVWLTLASGDAVHIWEEQIPKAIVRFGEPAAKGPPAETAHTVEPHGAGPANGKKEEPPPPPPIDPNVGITLAPAPAPGLIEETKAGPLPRISPDGRRAWQVYARPFPAEIKLPKIAIVVSDLGISGVTTGAALQQLPPTVTVAFVPYAERLDSWLDRARSAGHEALLTLPMEPADYPRSDPGPNALFTILKPERNTERLEAAMGKAAGYIGITSTTGSKFTANAKAMKPVLEEIKARGLMYFDAKASPDSVGLKLAQEMGLPALAADRFIDRDLSRGAIDDQLKGLEAVAKAQGAAVGLGFSYPNTIERIALWAVGLPDRGVTLAPLSAVISGTNGNSNGGAAAVPKESPHSAKEPAPQAPAPKEHATGQKEHK